MKKFLLSLFLLSAGFYSEGQVTFQKTYGGTGGFSIAESVQQTSDGGYIITGYTDCFGAGSSDVYLIKTDINGDTIWTRTFGGLNADIGAFVQQTSDSGYIITGSTKSFGVFYEDIYLIKTDANGSLLWSKAIAPSNYNGSSCVQQTIDGGFIILGSRSSFGSNYDFCLIKTNDYGDTSWIKTFGGVGRDQGLSVQQTNDSGYVMTGYTQSFGADSNDIYLAKTDNAGNLLWSKTFGGIGLDLGNCVRQTTDGGFIILGWTGSFGLDSADIYLIKTNFIGDTVWTKTLGGSGSDKGNSIEVTADGGYIIAGVTSSFGSVYTDVYLVKTDANGDPLWSNTYGGISFDQCNSVHQTTEGGYILAGSSFSFSADHHVYLIKTDSIGYSGCNEKSVTTNVMTPATQISNPSTQVSSGGSVFSTPTIVGGGGTVTTPCTTLGINPISNFQFPISISPNPSSGIFTITFPENFQKGKIEIYNVMGEKIYNEKINGGNKKEIYLQNISAGIYFVKVRDGGKEYAEKLVIQ